MSDVPALRDECCPGRPYMTFEKKPAISIVLQNPQVFSSFFEFKLTIADGDTVSRLISKLIKTEPRLKRKNFFFFINSNFKIICLYLYIYIFFRISIISYSSSF